MSFLSRIFRNQEKINKELIQAAYDDNLRRAQKSLLVGAVLNAKNQALAIAVRYHQKDMACILLGNGTDPNCEAYSERGSGLNRTVLIEAASQGDLPTFYALLARDAEIERQSKDGLTPLMCAASPLPSRKAGCLAIIKVLLAAGADHNRQAEDGKTALIRAAAVGFLQAVEVLLAHGAHLDTKDHVGMTAYNYAVLYKHQEVADLLVEHGADPSLVTPSPSEAGTGTDQPGQNQI